MGGPGGPGGRGKEKVAWVLVDGLGDVGCGALGGRTPLQWAATPHLDALAAAGVSGLVDPVEPGLACGSDTAHLALLGYEPRGLYRGRGAFESLGAGLEMGDGDIAFKCNFATLDEATGVVLRRRADRHFEALGPALCAALDGAAVPGFPEVAVRVKYATEHRCGVVVSGPGLTDQIAGTDPLKDGRPLERPRPLRARGEAAPAAHAAAVRTAAVVQAVSDTFAGLLRDHPLNAERAAQGKPPANVVLLRGCGSRLRVESFEARHRLRAFMVAPTKIIAGIGMTLGLDVVEAPGATGDYHTNLTAKAEATAERLDRGGYDLGFLHVKAVDDAGHDRNLPLKVHLIEAVDRMLGQLFRLLWRNARASGDRYHVLCTADHSTPVAFGDHSCEPVPLALARLDLVVKALGEAHVEGVDLAPFPMPAEDAALAAAQGGGEARRAARRVFGDAVEAFDEVACAAGFLGRFPGSEVMPLLRTVAAGGVSGASGEGGEGEGGGKRPAADGHLLRRRRGRGREGDRLLLKRRSGNVLSVRK